MLMLFNLKKGTLKGLAFLSVAFLLSLIIFDGGLVTAPAAQTNQTFEVTVDQTKVVTRTEGSENICRDVGGKRQCTLNIYSGARFAQDKLGEWVDASDVMGIRRNGDLLTFFYNGSKVGTEANMTFRAGAIINGNYLTMVQVKQNFPSVNFNFPLGKDVSGWKFAVNITSLPLAS